MQENLEEKISMLLDNELSSKEVILVLEEINKNDKLKEVWHRYNTIRLSLAADGYTNIAAQFNNQIAEQIGKSSFANIPLRKTNSYPKWGYALAASIVATVIFSWFQIINVPLSTTSTKTIASIESLPRLEAFTESNISSQPLSKSIARPAFDRQIQTLDPRFEDYLVTHNQVSSPAVQGMLPYARVVTYASK